MSFKPKTLLLQWHWLSGESPQSFALRVKRVLAGGYKATQLFAEVNQDYFKCQSSKLKFIMTPIKSIEVTACLQQ